MVKTNPSYQELYAAIDSLRKETTHRFDELEKKIDSNYCTHEEVKAKFDRVEDRISPLEKIVYGIVALILTGVFGALISLVINK